MKILITGAKGFIGKNLLSALRSGTETRPSVVLPADLDTPWEDLAAACAEADFVYHLAGVNRPKVETEFQEGNADFTARLLTMLEAGRHPPLLLTSSTQASLDNPYGRSKRKAEEAVRAYAKHTGAPVYIYRLTHAFGKWSRPNYNSAIATFCHNISRNLPVQVHDPAVFLQLSYIDDIIGEFLRALNGDPVRDGDFCHVYPVYTVSLGEVKKLLIHFRDSREKLDAMDQSDPFTRKLYATYLSFLPTEDFTRFPKVHTDARGSFTELLHMNGYGQISCNVILPHTIKGEHWHHTKHEKFIVVSGEGVIRFRRADDSGETHTYQVSGALPAIVDIPPGYTHNIENTGDTPMITLMWANEPFHPDRPDTYPMPVQP
ncbi:MAG: NAD-dependent epimerase/dehydratase family protein [Clostridia bacterium]|nr:NAD-dependent epimerase/dehydratase family protein [Clostridia bacterium]